MMCKNEACEGAAEDAALAIDGEMESRGSASFLRREQARPGLRAFAARTDIQDSDPIVRVQHGDGITRTDF